MLNDENIECSVYVLRDCEFSSHLGTFRLATFNLSVCNLSPDPSFLLSPSSPWSFDKITAGVRWEFVSSFLSLSVYAIARTEIVKFVPKARAEKIISARCLNACLAKKKKSERPPKRRGALLRPRMTTRISASHPRRMNGLLDEISYSRHSIISACFIIISYITTLYIVRYLLSLHYYRRLYI